MTRGDETAAAHIPSQPTPTPPSTSDDSDDFLDTDTSAETPTPAAGPGLDDRAKEILAFERRWWRQAGSKEQAIRDVFGLSATRYYQLLNALLDDPAALEFEPVVVARLRRLRASRIRSRGSARRQ